MPPVLAEKSVRELVRVAKRDVFTTISLRPSALDRPGRPPKARRKATHPAVSPLVFAVIALKPSLARCKAGAPVREASLLVGRPV